MKNYAEYKEWLILYKELLVIIKNKKDQYRLNPTRDLQEEIRGYLLEKDEYIKMIRNYESILIDYEFFSSLNTEDKKFYLNKLLDNLKKVNGKKDIITVNGNKISIAQKVKGRYISYSNILKRLNEVEVKKTRKDIQVINIEHKTGSKISKKSDSIITNRIIGRLKYGVAAAAVAVTTIFGVSNLNENEYENLKNYNLESYDDSYVYSNLPTDMLLNIESGDILDTTSEEIGIDTEESMIISDNNIPVVGSTMYYDIECSTEWQNYIFELAEKWDIPAEIGFTICERESGGTWNTNSVISPTNDYGVSQINICNHDFIYETLGYTSDEILNDPYKNFDSMFMIIRYIFDTLGYDSTNYDLESAYGTYNGWLNWRNISNSRNYADGCMEIMEETICPDNMTLTLSK